MAPFYGTGSSREISLCVQGAGKQPEGLGVCVTKAEAGRFGSTTDAIALPEAKPRTMSELFVMSPVCSREIACVHGPGIWRSEDTLEPLDLGNPLLGLHAGVIITRDARGSNQTGIHPFSLRLTGNLQGTMYPAVGKYLRSRVPIISDRQNSTEVRKRFSGCG